MARFWAFFIRKQEFTILLILALIAAGTFSLISIPKESSPEVKVPIGIVTTVLPGASAKDVEQLVTNEIEDGLINLPDLDKLSSTSREGVSTVIAEFDASADIDKSIRELKDAVDAVKPELPDEANDPIVSEVNFADQPVIIVSISGDYVPSELTRLGDKLQEELERTAGVSRVDVSGVREREVQVVVDKEKLQQYGIGITDVVGALRSANASLPIGSLSINDIDYAIKLNGNITDPREVGDIALLNRGGIPVYVRDVAFISDGLAKTATFSRVSENASPAAPALTLYVFKTAGGNIVEVSDDVKARLEELKKEGVITGTAVISFDGGKQVQKDLSELTQAGLETIALVMLSLFLTIGWRESVVAGASIPLSFLIAFIGLQASGNTINFISLFSLILAIGILVDSGIVVTEAIHTRLRATGNKQQAAFLALQEYAWPLIAGTMTTIAVFVPLFFLSGIIGEFIYSIPFTLVFVLIASIFVALGIVPLMAVLFTKTTQSRLEARQEEWSHQAQDWYRAFLSRILDSRRFQNRFLAGMIVAFIAAIALPATGLVKSVFFPGDNVDFLYVEIEKPEGSSLGSTDIATRAAEEILYENPRIASFVTTVGSGSSFSQSPLSGAKLANITILLKDGEDSAELLRELRDSLSTIPHADIRVYEPSGGPPSGAPVVISFRGDSLEELEQAVSKAETVLASIDGTTDITTSTRGIGLEFTVTVDKAKATALGLNPAAIAQILRTSVNGVTATTIKTQTDDIDVEVKLNLDPTFIDASVTNTATPDAIRTISVQTPNGTVLLGSIVDITLNKSNAVIRHEDRERIESLSAYVKEGVTALEVTQAFEGRVAELELPDTVIMKIGGETEDIERSFREMGLAFVSGLALMLAILVLEFNSFRRTLYLLSIVPLSLIGVFAGLFLTGKPLSFSSLLGVIALAGVIINHAIILMDSMERIHREKNTLSHRDTVIEASVSRLRPIFLTTVTTIVGMIPLATISPLWGPLAYAIMFGLTFAMVLTLVLIPVLYYRWPGKRYGISSDEVTEHL